MSTSEARSVPAGLEAWLTEARELGLLGPGPVEAHVAHAQRFVDELGSVAGRVLDLGTGAGVPGLILASWWPETRWLLLDGKETRAALVSGAVERLGWQDRIEVRAGRAEELARDDRWREQVDLVVARSFGPPAVTAECAAGFVRVGGRVAVSEPPRSDGTSRWPATPLLDLGLQPGPERPVQVLTKVSPTPDRYPRRVGIPSKRPLF